MSSSSCKLYLDNYPNYYSPGDTIVGRVSCFFNSPKSIQGIRLKLSGKERTEWTSRRGKHSSTYTGKNSLLLVQHTLVGEGDLPKGRHEYSFSLTLPTNLPGTYSGKYGSISYSLKATVDRPYKFDYKDKKAFNVVAPINFNDIKETLQLGPVAYCDEEVPNCFCCANGSVSMNVHLLKEAFVVGEIVPIRIEINNMSNVNVQTVEVKMAMDIISTASKLWTESKTEHELIATCRSGGVGAHGNRIYDLQMEIPGSTVVPNFRFATLFEESTKIEVTAVVAGCNSNLGVEFKVTLGHIPIVDGQQNYSIITEQFPAATAIPDTWVPTAPS
ncbi:hypothetical protein NQ317_001723 [Molorchus minor]|uniref:Arrestin C-terminal-like domain-containing protein n=1 Tax=Molorchus minor TaxID=1323400 RepID=A0ABQ9IXK0_9CUCU|nr:hypothetical protein NQ317_001723 [Molorchus minor]